MSASPSVRSFWAAKDREDGHPPDTTTPATSPRAREGRTMEGLRSTLARTWEQSRTAPKAPTTTVHDLPAKIVTNSPFKEYDRTPSPSSSPTLSRRNTPSPTLVRAAGVSPTRPDSPYKSSLANNEANSKYGSLSRSKSVTFNELPEIRHMSACSYDPASSPFSMTDHSDSGSDEDDDVHGSNISDDADNSLRKHNNNSSSSPPMNKTLPNLEDPFVTSPKKNLPTLPNITTIPRPLPVIPAQRARSPEQRIMATEQEDCRKPFPGLGLHLHDNNNDPKSDLDIGSHENDRSLTYNADEALIRRTSQRTMHVSEHFDSDSSDEAALSKATMRDVSEKSVISADLSSPPRSSPILRTYSPSRSPELVISREYVKEKMAQRRLAKEAKGENGLDAFKPRESLAPPLPHFDSFVKMTQADAAGAVRVPDSPISDAEFPSRVIPQRKVSDSTRPSTPTSQVTTSVPEPQSGRAVHHDREKRLSSDLAHSLRSVHSPKPLFAPVNYDGDEYDDDDELSPPDDHVTTRDILHASKPNVEPDVAFPTSSTVQESAKDSTGDRGSCTDSSTTSPDGEEEILRTLPEIPDVPVRDRAEISAEARSLTPEPKVFDMRHMSLSLNFENFGSDSLGLEDFMTPEGRPETPITSRTVAPVSPTKVQNDSRSQLEEWVQTSAPVSSDVVPEAATITARGLKLRTRPSMTPADAVQLAERRRKVSAEAEIETSGQSQVVLDSDATLGRVRSESVTMSCAVKSASHEALEGTIEGIVERPHESETKEPYDIIQPIARPVLQPLQKDLSFSDIDSAFDRVMQKQKKGYVVRQQSRVIYASAHHTEDAENTVSQGANGQDASKGHTRQSSSVYTDISNFSGLTQTSNENYKSHKRQGSRIPVGVQMSPNPETVMKAGPRPDLYEHADGGRLFVKVMHVRHLTLPIPSGEESFFCCTLDNGKHCVTTPMHPLASNVKINQEFELIANHDLEFILTLQAQYVPPVMPVRPKSTLGRLLNSPRKHRPTGSITSLSLSGHVGTDGSFARAHLALKHFRRKAFGRPHSISVPVLNEWALETTGVIKGVPQTRVRKPYKIGEIEVQVLYVPPVEVDHRQALPTSLSQAVRDIRDAEWHSKLHCEGFLSQQGGDCPYWRRRHFKLVGSKLTAYHANTGQIRANINLSKALKITDDKDSLTAPDVSVGRGDNKKRRKSGFAEREEGHLYVAEGFRIRFANGEFIDFYADTGAEKEKWISALDTVVQKVPVIKEWAKIVLQNEAGSASGECTK